jgi:hypothetical protein
VFGIPIIIIINNNTQQIRLFFLRKFQNFSATASVCHWQLLCHAAAAAATRNLFSCVGISAAKAQKRPRGWFETSVPTKRPCEHSGGEHRPQQVTSQLFYCPPRQQALMGEMQLNATRVAADARAFRKRLYRETDVQQTALDSMHELIENLQNFSSTVYLAATVRA